MAEIKKIWFGAGVMDTALGNYAETLSAILENRSGLEFSQKSGMVTGEIKSKPVTGGYTELESLMIRQMESVLSQSGLTLGDNSVRFVLSTTKGNVSLLEGNTDHIPDDAFLYFSAEKVAAYFGAVTKPIVISNACISGVSAFVVARRMILSGECDHVLVLGCDLLCDFVTSGFASFKSISSQLCRPYDVCRDGLNLGEACACVLVTSDEGKAVKPLVRLEGGSVTNDANHISGPSRTGDGLFYAIRNAMSEAGVRALDIGMVNTHGTATAYNDEMESKAVALAGLSDVPLNSLKGYIGHTLGASGVVETLLCISEIRDGVVFGTKGFTALGVPCAVNIAAEHRKLGKSRCVKTASGFGGCNAAIVIAAEECNDPVMGLPKVAEAECTAEYSLSTVSSMLFAEHIRQEYKALDEPNMKFFKMSDLCKGAYVVMENLMRMTNLSEKYEKTDIAVILAGKSSSLDTDIAHQRILEKRLPEGTSPAVFVYTLPSVAAGEICIRHKFQGDNTFFIDNNDARALCYARLLIERGFAKAVVCGWCEKLEEKYSFEFKVLEIK